MLVERISEGWSPSQDAESGTSDSQDPIEPNPISGDEAVLSTLERAGSDLTQAHDIRHFSYFPTKALAERAAKALLSQGYKIEETHEADDQSWLVLASHSTILSSEVIGDVRSHLEAIASSFNGEYDGWEAAVKIL